MSDPVPDIHVFKLAAAVTGALVSLRFVQGTWPERLIMAAGGAAMSYLGSGTLAAWLNAPEALGLIGFFTGLFGMAIVAKVYEGIEAIDAKKVGAEIWEKFKRKWEA